MNDDNKAARCVKALLFLTLVSVLGSALLTPFIYSGLSALFNPFPWPFSRVFNRVFLFLIIVCVIIKRKDLALADAIHLLRGNHRSALFIVGATFSVSTLFIGLPIVVYGGHELLWVNNPMEVLATKTLTVIITALIVSVLEEVLFRGVLFHALKSKIGILGGAILGSLIYATLHFLTPDKSFTYTSFNLFAGFEYLGLITQKLTQPGILSGIFGLFLVGLTLTQAMLSTKSLWLAIGLHAGWIFAAKFSLFLTDGAPGVEFPSSLGRRYFFVAEPSVWCVVMVIFLLVRLIPWRTTETEQSV